MSNKAIHFDQLTTKISLGNQSGQIKKLLFMKYHKITSIFDYLMSNAVAKNYLCWFYNNKNAFNYDF